MQFLALFVLVCVASAALQSLVKILVILTLLAFAVSFITRPAEALTGLFGLLTFGMIARHPLVAAIVLGMALIAGVFRGN